MVDDDGQGEGEGGEGDHRVLRSREQFYNTGMYDSLLLERKIPYDVLYCIVF